MYQYGIYIRNKNGRPYMIDFFDDLISAKNRIYEMVLLEENRGRPYFVDNDFFDNKYSNIYNLKYICLLYREVTEFKVYSEKKDSFSSDNIIFFTNFKKMY